LLKLGPTHLTTESSSGNYISAHNLSLEARRYLDGKGRRDELYWYLLLQLDCTFYANAATSAVFLCPLGTGSVVFEDLHDFGCLACRPGDTQVLNVTRRPAVSMSNGDINQGAVFLEGGCCDPGLAAQSFIVQALICTVNLYSNSHSRAAA
ncbi:unnamed protein product, partial [Symbiodinium necroappetens]